MGDPAGIGLDLALVAWSERTQRGLAPFALIGDPHALAVRRDMLGIDAALTEIDDLAAATGCFPDALPVLPVRCAAPVVAGEPDSRNAAAVIAAIERAVLAVRRGEARAIVTNPIAKSVLMTAGFAHPGHTEFLGVLADTHFANGEHNAERSHPVMLLASDALKVVPLTVHIPLADVARSITTELIVETAIILHRALADDFGLADPRIAVTGLNPHAGEDGKIGDEDAAIIAPAIAALLESGMAISGPHPADTLFHERAREGYDAVLAMYHDQALIPIKTLAFDTGVNVTIGLPFVRTSPDHGTAFSLAGTGSARASSLIEALKLADAISARRSAAQSVLPS